MKQARNKDEFREIMDRYLPLVSRTSYRIMCDRVDSEYITKSVFKYIWNNPDILSSSRPLKDVILVKTCNLCRMRLFRRRLLKMLSINPDIFVMSLPAVPSADEYTSRLAWSLFCRASADYSDRERMVYTLCELERIQTDEVAEILSLRLSSVEESLDLAKAKVMDELDIYGRMNDYELYIGFLRKIEDQLTDVQKLTSAICKEL